VIAGAVKVIECVPMFQPQPTKPPATSHRRGFLASIAIVRPRDGKDRVIGYGNAEAFAKAVQSGHSACG
jgi:hypothetical protein